ncbi:MAG: PLP-dependent aminotransferase family protein [Candidatus Hermodarchaeota archaeon]|nr:PLP-dependent aminotransferase family protein [Candidatus Hermodarchaeota archaeon]
MTEEPYGFAAWTQFIPESEIRRLLKFNVPYYFGGGKPGALPIETLAQTLIDLGNEQLEEIRKGNEERVIDDFNYGPTGGKAFLRETLAKRLIDKDGLTLNPENPADDVMITTGSQQALYAIIDTCIDQGDVILTTSPAYLGFLVPAVKLGAQVVTVPTDLQGAIPEYFEDAIRLCKKELGKKPELLYVVPDSDNPKGTTVPTKRREALFEIAQEHKLLIIEDGAYREIQFRKPREKPIKAFDTENKYVAYLRTSSKEAAVLRIGYSVFPPKMREQINKDKGFLDLCSPTIVQRLLNIYYTRFIDNVLPNALKTYKERADVMLKAIDETFPAGSRTEPTGGFFIWWENEEKKFDAKKFLEQVALPNDIIYVPGIAFYPLMGMSYSPEDQELVPVERALNTMRLSYSYSTPKVIDAGIRKLGGLLQKSLT